MKTRLGNENENENGKDKKLCDIKDYNRCEVCGGVWGLVEMGKREKRVARFF